MRADTRRITKRHVIWLLGLWVLLACSACAAKVTVDQVMTDPGRYRGKKVVVTGVVDKPMAVAGHGVYRINNGNAHLWVQTTQGVPRPGTTAQVTGRIYDAFDMRGMPLPLPDAVREGMVLIESSRDVSP
jgi:hypothetical protein